MQEEKSILSKTYTPVAVSESATVTFNKVTVSGNVTINGRIVRNSAEIGQVSYNTKSGALIVKLYPLTDLTTIDQSAILGSLPGYINELLTE